MFIEPAMTDADASLFDRLRQFDEQRPSVPGEHWIAFGLGLYLLLRRRSTLAGRLASMSAGALFVTRALSGRDGAIAALKPRSAQDHEPGFAQVAATWPYDKPVLLSKPKPARPGDPSIAGAISSAPPLSPSP